MNRCLVFALLLIGWPFAWSSAQEASPSIAAAEAWLQTTSPETQDELAVYQAALQEHEALEPLLDKVAEDDGTASRWLRAKLHWRYGLLEEAQTLYEQLAEETASAQAAYHVAQLVDARGMESKAVEAYTTLLQREDAKSWHEAIRLRLAIFKSTGGKVDDFEDLSAYAESHGDKGFKNRASVVLALAGKPKEAMELYQVDGEDESARFKQEIRVAEWAMAAKETEKAQEAAWRALQLSKLKRDRRYALTILAEAYRQADALEALVERFAATEALSAEARHVWIEILRELGKADEALAMFQDTASDQGFTPEMRRELLEICRETGRDEVLVEAYQQAIAEQPERLEWRAGLSRFFLEQGNRELGHQAWEGFLGVADVDTVLEAAAMVQGLGMQDLAIQYAEKAIASDRVIPGLQFLFQMHKNRGEDAPMVEVLERMETMAPADSANRVQLAESWEQIGRQDKAADVLRRLREARGPENFSADLEMRLAWLYSETGDEEKAFDHWHRVWLRVESPGRRRYVEDRLMATASRLGKLADIAIELEEKLLSGKADKRDSALLVRLYVKVGDPVSASEIIEEFLKQSGGSEVQLLEEKARIYVMCNDYYHYEQTLRELMRLDPEGTPEYLTQLAMSCLERGKHDQAREVLLEMRSLPQNAASAEFEAGVLKIAGMHEEATAAYWRGIAEQPNRIDAYLLLGDALKTVGKATQAQGVFQYLVEHADKDDLFTIAIDGLLNARVGQPVLRWARRVILERISQRDDKVYLYQLLGDLSEELRDQAMLVRSLSETLPIAGERRTSQLRELVELAKVGVGGSGSASRGIRAAKDREGLMRYGRRLIGMGEAVPPQVHLDLGHAFLDGGDIRSAAKTFARAEDMADFNAFQRKVAASFEQKRYVENALRVYEKLLLGDQVDVSLLLKLGELKETLGEQEQAREAYERVLDVLISQQPAMTLKDEGTQASQQYVYARNQDSFGKYFNRAITGYLTTATEGVVLERFLEEQERALAADLEQVRQFDRAEADQTLRQSPRAEKRAGLIRRVAAVFGQQDRIERVYRQLIESFPHDTTLLPGLSRTLLSWGMPEVASRLMAASPDHPSHAAGERLLERVHGKDGDGWFRDLLERQREESRVTLRERVAAADDSEAQLGGELFSAALFLQDQQMVAMLARRALMKTPSAQVWQYSSILSRVWPHVDDTAKEALTDLVATKLEDLDPSTNTSLHYYMQQLNRLTGRRFTLGREHLEAPLKQALSQGGYYLNSLGSLFNALDREEYAEALKETYPKLKGPTRLQVLFTLIKSFEGGMDDAFREFFTELVLDAAVESKEDPVLAWEQARRYSSGEKEQNLGFGADLLGKLAAALEEAKQTEMKALRATLLLQDGERVEEAVALAKEVQVAALAKDSKVATARVQALQRAFLPAYFQPLLEAFDRAEKVEGNEPLEIAKQRIAFVKQVRDQGLLMQHLELASSAFPEEQSFREERRRLLESMGLLWEALELQQELVEKDPKNASLRQALANLWKQLEHPVQADLAEQLPQDDAPAPVEAKNEDAAATPAPAPARTVAAVPMTRVTPAVPMVTAARVATVAVAGSAPSDDASSDLQDEEKQLPPANMNEVKSRVEAGELAEAQHLFRRVWRRFDQLDASRGYVYYNPYNTGLYRWPSSQSASVASNVPSPLGGLKGFLTQRVIDPSEVRRRAQENQKTIFEVEGDRAFVQEEAARALRGLEPNQYLGTVFQQQVDVLARADMAMEGLEQALKNALSAMESGEVPPLDRVRYASLLEMSAEEEEDVDEALIAGLRDALFRLARANDTASLMRLASCQARTGQPERALAVYRWCASKTTFSPYNYGDGRLTTRSLIDEVRQHLEGDHEVRALESVFELSRPTSTDLRYMVPYYMLVLNTWKEVLPAEQALRRTATICEEVMREHLDQPMLAKLVSVFLASGGAVNEAAAALRHALTSSPPPGPNGTTMVVTANGSVNYVSGNSALLQGGFTDADLRLFFPESMESWKAPASWLATLSGLVRELHGKDQLTDAQTLRILALAAIRQHDLGFEDAARRNLSTLQELELTLPDQHLWLLDVAEHMQEDAVWLRLAKDLLGKRQLLVARVPEVIRKVAEIEGSKAAMALARESLDYTMHPTLVSDGLTLARQSGDEAESAFWTEQWRLLWEEESNAARYGIVLRSDDSTRLYRYEELSDEPELEDRLGNQTFSIRFDPDLKAVAVTSTGRKAPAIPELVLVEEWRKIHPEGEVYLVSMLENAKTFLIEKGSDGWRYYDGQQAPPATWSQPGFDDTSWQEGTAPLGYGESVRSRLSFGGDSANKTLTAYFRKTVNVDDPKAYVKVYATMESDDGAIVYVNGKEVHRMNMRAEDADSHTTTAAGKGEKGQPDTFFIDPNLLQAGDNGIAISVHQADSASSDLYLNMDVRVITKEDLKP